MRVDGEGQGRGSRGSTVRSRRELEGRAHGWQIRWRDAVEEIVEEIECQTKRVGQAPMLI